MGEAVHASRHRCVAALRERSTTLKSACVVAGIVAVAVAGCGPAAAPMAMSGTATAQTTPTLAPATAIDAAPAGATPAVEPSTGPPVLEEQPSASSETPIGSDMPGPAPTPDLRGFRTAPAPAGLARVPLPDDFAEVRALFEQLPAEVAGIPRWLPRSPQLDSVTPTRAGVGYGQDQRIPNHRGPQFAFTALDLSQGDFFPPNWSGGQVVAEMSSHGEEIKEAGRDGDLIWAQRDTFVSTAESTERYPVYTLQWGGIDSSWMFSISADTPEHRDALLGAVIAASGTEQ